MSIYRNPSISILYQNIFRQGLEVSNTGALLAYSGEKTGRSPLDKRIVKDETTKNIWWGNVNRPITPNFLMFTTIMQRNITQVVQEITDLLLMGLPDGTENIQ